MPRKPTAPVSDNDQITLRRSDYEALIRRLEDLEDVLAIDIARGDKDRTYIPAEVVKRLVSRRESKITVWREHRGLSQRSLAGEAGIAPTYLSEIENGKKPGSVKALAAIARALRVEIEDLITRD